ncbi:MAG: SOS response-associated peptidase [Pseudomonadota bacterium]
MCGRFVFYSPLQATAELFGVHTLLESEPRYNIAPTQYVPAIRESDDGRELAMLKWGLIPFWAKEASIGNRMINARAETVTEKPSYRNAYKHRRCLVLADGFYEWHRDGDSKTPYFISLASGEPFAFAGLWERWKDKAADEVIDSTTLITAEANNFLSTVHHRMPLMLTPETASRWLAGDDELIHEIHDVTPPLKAWPVSRRVNNARNDGDDLVEPDGESLA